MSAYFQQNFSQFNFLVYSLILDPYVQRLLKNFPILSSACRPKQKKKVAGLLWASTRRGGPYIADFFIPPHPRGAIAATLCRGYTPPTAHLWFRAIERRAKLLDQESALCDCTLRKLICSEKTAPLDAFAPHVIRALCTCSANVTLSLIVSDGRAHKRDSPADGRDSSGLINIPVEQRDPTWASR